MMREQEKSPMQCISRAQACHQNQVTVAVAEGADTTATAIGWWGSPIRQPRAGRAAPVSPAPRRAREPLREPRGPRSPRQGCA